MDDAHASVRSEAEDERPSPAASNLTRHFSRNRLIVHSLWFLRQLRNVLAPSPVYLWETLARCGCNRCRVPA